MHRGAHEAIHEDGTCRLVDFIFHWIRIHGNFNNYIECFRDFISGRNVIK